MWRSTATHTPITRPRARARGSWGRTGPYPPSLPKLPAAAVVAQISAAGDWQDSGVRVRRGERYHLRATGTWSIGAICGTTDASGAGVGFLCAGDAWGIGVTGSTLIGRIGDDGAPFRVGRELDLNATSDGVLFLRAYDNLPWDNSGAVTVRITELTPRQAASATKQVATLTPQQTGPFDGEWVGEIVWTERASSSDKGKIKSTCRLTIRVKNNLKFKEYFVCKNRSRNWTISGGVIEGGLLKSTTLWSDRGIFPLKGYIWEAQGKHTGGPYWTSMNLHRR